jgi:molybdenum ABC transporter molybdate-binding protein
MMITKAKQRALSAAAALLISSPLPALAWSTNINLAVASNFYGLPPDDSAIADLINEFEAENPNYSVTVVDNGATATLESHIISGNQLKVDLFLAADTSTPQDLLVNYFKLVAPYNSSYNPPLYTFNYAQGVLAFLSNTPGVDVTCDAGGTCGFNPNVYSTVAIADPSLAPYGVAAQSVLISRFGLAPPLSSNPSVHEYPNITAAYQAVINQVDPVGFVALSAICSAGQYPTSGTSALVYFAIESSSTTPPAI